LLILILRTLCSALAGFGCGFAAEKWIRELLSDRERDYPLSAKAEWLLRLACALLGGVMGALLSEIPAILCGLILLIVLTVLSVTDWTYRLIPNPCVLAILILKIVFGVPALLGLPGFPECSILQSLIGLAALGLLFAMPGLFGKNVGAGDIKLAAAMGFFLGLRDALLAVIVMGLLVICYSLVQGKVPVLKFFKEYIPIGPFIAVGFLAIYIAASYLSLITL